jgi:hypothetical protein
MVVNLCFVRNSASRAGVILQSLPIQDLSEFDDLCPQELLNSNGRAPIAVLRIDRATRKGALDSLVIGPVPAHFDHLPRRAKSAAVGRRPPALCSGRAADRSRSPGGALQCQLASRVPVFAGPRPQGRRKRRPNSLAKTRSTASGGRLRKVAVAADVLASGGVEPGGGQRSGCDAPYILRIEADPFARGGSSAASARNPDRQ